MVAPSMPPPAPNDKTRRVSYLEARRILGGNVPPPAMPKGREAVGAATDKGHSHFNATNTTCLLGHAHPSKVEARVCARVHHERADGDVIYRNVRLPLFALPPTARGIAMYLNVDFVVTRNRRMVRIIDAKSGRRSRDWARGAAACEATYGLKVEECDA
jgi:hypothetical protein